MTTKTKKKGEKKVHILGVNWVSFEKFIRGSYSVGTDFIQLKRKRCKGEPFELRIIYDKNYEKYGSDKVKEFNEEAQKQND